MNDDVILEGARLLDQVGGERAPSAGRARRPLAGHPCDANLARRHAKPSRPLAYALLELIGDQVSLAHGFRCPRMRSPISTIRFPETSFSRTLYISAFNCRSSSAFRVKFGNRSKTVPISVA